MTQPYKSNSRESKAQYYLRNREGILAKARAKRACPDFLAKETAFKRTYHLRIRYGITHEQYMALLEQQGHKCAICGTTDPGTKKSTNFDVDHCHTTGKVRSLLCRNCNVTVGVVEKKADLIKKIHDYLARHK